MKRILVAVGEDGFGKHIVTAAAELAKKMNASLTVCNIMPDELYREIQTRLNSEQLGHSFVFAHAEQRANSVAAHAAESVGAMGVDYLTKGKVGKPAQEIIALANELDVELIVVGFEALHGLGKIRALGSVSRAVMEDASCPVLIVPLPEVLHTEVTETEEVHA